MGKFGISLDTCSNSRLRTKVLRVGRQGSKIGKLMTDQPQRTKQFYRSSGAIVGLGLGYGVMSLTGLTGMVASAVFWGTGCVVGGMVAEQVFRWNSNQGR